MTATYGTMQARIADEVMGPITTTHIQNAIQDAIRLYERQRFWFNEARFDQSPVVDTHGQPVLDGNGNFVLSSPLFTTVPGLEYYGPSTTALIGSMAHIDKLVLVQASNRYTLNWKTPQWMDDAAVGLLWRAIPTDWTYNAKEVRLYPIPDLAYPILGWGTQRFPALVDVGDTNPWMCEAELLIRSQAKLFLYTHITRNATMAATMKVEVFGDPMDPKNIGALRALRGETAERAGPSAIRPTVF